MSQVKFDTPRIRHSYTTKRASFFVQFLISNKLAKTPKQATFILFVVAMILLSIASAFALRDGRAPIQETIDPALQEQYFHEAKQQ